MPRVIKNSSSALPSPSLKSRGAALTDYLPIIFVVSLMAIVGFASFGEQLRQKTAEISDILSGSSSQNESVGGRSSPEKISESGSSLENSAGNNGLITNSLDFATGAVTGLSSQVKGLWEIATNPVETVENLVTLGEALIEDPEATLQAIGDELGEDVSALVDGDWKEKGYVIGSYVSPAVLAKVAIRVSKISTGRKRKTENEGCSSFAAGTLVWTKRGLRPINELNVGDQVLARNDENYSDSYQTVKKLHHRDAEHYYQIRVQQHFIEVTEEHPFWKQSVGWVTARSLTSGDVIATAEGDLVVREVKRVNQPLKVHNLTIANDHNYFVSQYGLWVHNMSGGKPCEVLAEKLENATKKVDLKQTGSYTNTHASGKTYVGKGSRQRSQVSGRRETKRNSDPHTATDWTSEKNDREAFKQESRRLDAQGGPKSPTNYNRIEQPGKKYRKQDGE